MLTGSSVFAVGGKDIRSEACIFWLEKGCKKGGPRVAAEGGTAHFRAILELY